ncbi:MAG: histidine--tRNA ligase [Myxococcota bacterium]
MSDKKTISLVRGMKDLHPEEMGKWRKLEGTARKIFRRYGYAEFRSPILERLELFARGVGETTDIVEKEMYAFQDADGESLALRPEGTASVVRAFIESGGLIAHPEWRVYYIGPMFRRERPQKGRYRQFHQIGVEAFGSPSAGVDAEQIKILWLVAEELGVKNARFGVNSLGCPVCRPGYREKLVSYFAKKTSDLCENCNRRLSINPLRILDCKEEACKVASKSAPLMIDNLCDDCKTHFDELKRSLEYLGLREDKEFGINPYIVRGLDYYNRTAFELIAEDKRLGSQSSLAGGGRYDGLVETLGGKPTPAVGWALGCERLISLIDDGGKTGEVEVFVAAFPKTLGKAVEIAEGIRASGVAAVVEYEPRGLKAQLKRAARLEAKFVLILGENELSLGKIELKSLETGLQVSYNIGDIEGLIKELKKKLKVDKNHIKGASDEEE